MHGVDVLGGGAVEIEASHVRIGEPRAVVRSHMRACYTHCRKRNECQKRGNS